MAVVAAASAEISAGSITPAKHSIGPDNEILRAEN